MSVTDALMQISYAISKAGSLTNTSSTTGDAITAHLYKAQKMVLENLESRTSYIAVPDVLLNGFIANVSIAYGACPEAVNIVSKLKQLLEALIKEDLPIPSSFTLSMSGKLILMWYKDIRFVRYPLPTDGLTGRISVGNITENVLNELPDSQLKAQLQELYHV